MQKSILRVVKISVLLILAYFILMIPDFNRPEIKMAGNKPFAWNSDSLWHQLELNFITAKQINSKQSDSIIQLLFDAENKWLNEISETNINSTDARLNSLLNNYFILASFIAANPKQRNEMIDLYSNFRYQIKRQSQRWDLNETASRNTIYKILYGVRAATEEVLLQTDQLPFDAVMKGSTEESDLPFTNIFGIKVHSGDLLLSRGGAAVSALISRGNNYPGNFSHVALIYVDEKTNIPWLIEAHIELGVAVSSLEQYISDKKMRFMVLRPNAALPSIIKNPGCRIWLQNLLSIKQKQHIFLTILK